MNVDSSTLLGGSLSWQSISSSSQAEVARKSGVDKSQVSRAFSGQEGLSIASAKSLARFTEASPAAIYAASHTMAVKNRAKAGAISPGQVLAGIGRVVDGLTQFTVAEKSGADEVIRKSFEVLGELADEARGTATPESGSLDALGRTGTGLKAVKQHDPSAPEEPITPAEKNERPRRNPDGTSRTKIM